MAPAWRAGLGAAAGRAPAACVGQRQVAGSSRDVWEQSTVSHAAATQQLLGGDTAGPASPSAVVSARLSTGPSRLGGGPEFLLWARGRGEAALRGPAFRRAEDQAQSCG